MSTLLEIKTACANYLNISVNDLTQNGQDLFLMAANQVVTMAELANDFEFSRKTLSLTVNGLTGGNLGLARDLDGNLAEVKTVIEVGLLDTTGNLCPVEWTTTSESLTRQREDNMSAWPRYPTDDTARGIPYGGTRFTFSGDKVMAWPRSSETDSVNYALYLEGYTFSSDWTANDLLTTSLTISGTITPDFTGTFVRAGIGDGGTIIYQQDAADLRYISYYVGGGYWTMGSYSAGGGDFIRSNASVIGAFTATGGATGTPTVSSTTATSDIWTTHGQKYLLWATLVQLNHIWRRWVARQEGNLPPPAQLADEGLQALIAWDAYRFEGFRTHNR